MKFALLDGKRVEAFPKGRASCPICGAETIAKCGSRNMHHWAHYGRRECDPWWENETPWHREWKNLFPENCCEVSHTAEDGEIHRADIKTPTGIVIEIQHSNMKDDERISREVFYKNMVWIIDGSVFKQNFDIYHMLPSPESEIAQDIVWAKAKRHMHGANEGIFFRLSDARQEYPNISKSTLLGGQVHCFDEIRNEVEQACRGHFQFDWVRPRKTWLSASCPVYIDFGDEYLVKMEVYDESMLKCVRIISKKKFIHDVMIESDVAKIATRFYPINC